MQLGFGFTHFFLHASVDTTRSLFKDFFAILEHERSIICLFFDMRLDSSHPACALAGTTSLGSWVKSVDKFSSGKVHHQTAHHNHRQNHLAPLSSHHFPKPNILREAILRLLLLLLKWKCWSTNTGYRSSSSPCVCISSSTSARLHIMIDGTVRHGLLNNLRVWCLIWCIV
jgi:hypothetical protein